MLLPKIYFHTFGCRLNQGETSILEGLFKQADFEITTKKEQADIFLINTCTVTANGDLDTRKLINQIIRANPNAKIAIIGCQAQTQKQELLTLPKVKWVIGNSDKMELVDIIKNSLKSITTSVIVNPIPKKYFSMPIVMHSNTHTRANLKIQDGCDYFCSYCEVPFARGRSRSRVFGNILEEAELLAKNGYKEIVLTGVNTGTYEFKDKRLLNVLKSITELAGIERVRISSIEPKTTGLEIFKFMVKNKKVCRHLHSPVQSCNDTILKAMNRIYSFAEFKDFILSVKKLVPDICIGTDVIVGFPGETEELFNDTYQKLETLPIDYFHVFSYSKRKLARSKDLPDHISAAIIQKRSQKLRQLGILKRQKFFKSLLGQTVPVLFEQKKNGFWSGLTSHYVRVLMKSDQDLRNKICLVKLEKIEGQNIIANFTN
ncbi:MAG: tRNA (N(6)-L-threonylcarbamoyladenosine(37)-C(2))-methylthiotransferase MtaB [Candidatus Omnitrophica bacterium]|nr:tRNA (N(6)-L-threonylcarbamoyladenosine(37)-C(2))-methylthiotransferase MtaB [Candidatus Omnitrophota bacterium]